MAVVRSALVLVCLALSALPSDVFGQERRGSMGDDITRFMSDASSKVNQLLAQDDSKLTDDQIKASVGEAALLYQSLAKVRAGVFTGETPDLLFNPQDSMHAMFRKALGAIKSYYTDKIDSSSITVDASTSQEALAKQLIDTSNLVYSLYAAEQTNRSAAAASKS